MFVTGALTVPAADPFAALVETFVPLQRSDAAVLWIEADQPTDVERGEFLHEPAVFCPARRNELRRNRVPAKQPLDPLVELRHRGGHRLGVHLAPVDRLAIALLLTGGLDALKTAAITTALPFSVVLLLTCWSTIIAFTRERRAYDKAEREVLLEHVGAYYGLEVEGPAERAGTGEPLRALRRRLRGRAAPEGHATVSTAPDALPVRVDPVSADPGIDASLDRLADGGTGGPHHDGRGGV